MQLRHIKEYYSLRGFKDRPVRTWNPRPGLPAAGRSQQPAGRYWVTVPGGDQGVDGVPTSQRNVPPHPSAPPSTGPSARGA